MLIRVVAHFEAVREFDVEIPDGTPDSEIRDVVDTLDAEPSQWKQVAEDVDWEDPVTTDYYKVKGDGEVEDDPVDSR